MTLGSSFLLKHHMFSFSCFQPKEIQYLFVCVCMTKAKFGGGEQGSLFMGPLSWLVEIVTLSKTLYC